MTEELPASKLGTKEHWDMVYERETKEYEVSHSAIRSSALICTGTDKSIAACWLRKQAMKEKSGLVNRWWTRWSSGRLSTSHHELTDLDLA